MGQGIQVFNADGSLQFDSSSRLSRVLGQVYSGTDPGSISVPGFVQGTPWYHCIGVGNSALIPEVSISGTTLSWAFPWATHNPALIIYGVY
ncbi:hypothetical protein HF909_09175 [Ralstonia pseudosolanacearum]|uniref:Uncharacterized protein n=1 Tax=Ralstonia solanacearum TaxID=305 RepID=A0AA92K1B1_RALSL|nr:hypothetical protein [Ralstonia pseudosolanacearum]QOK96592.1 hypothetical protein HF909_09175 [Ralstonia pseudosolanacearum]